LGWVSPAQEKQCDKKRQTELLVQHELRPESPRHRGIKSLAPDSEAVLTRRKSELGGDPIHLDELERPRPSSNRLAVFIRYEEGERRKDRQRNNNKERRRRTQNKRPFVSTSRIYFN